jgi:protein ImuA
MANRFLPTLQPRLATEPHIALVAPVDHAAARTPVPVDLAPAALHELHAAADGIALSAAVLALAHAGGSAPGLWVRHAALDRETGRPYPPGLGEFGLDPAQLILVRAWDALSALQAGLEGARCPGLSAVIIELWGETRAYDLTASRRLALAAKTSGVRVFVARIAAPPVPSAAETRWQLRGAPSRALAANAPGNPAFDLTLLRARNGQEGLSYHLEWNRDAGTFMASFVKAGIGSPAAPPPADGSPPLSGAVVPVLFDRPDPPSHGAFPQRVLPQRVLPQRRAG